MHLILQFSGVKYLGIGPGAHSQVIWTIITLSGWTTWAISQNSGCCMWNIDIPEVGRVVICASLVKANLLDFK